MSKKMVFPIKFIGGHGELSVSFLGDLIHRSHDAKGIMQKICEQLSRAIEFTLERMDSYRLAYHDSLTQVYNRMAFEEDIERILNQRRGKKVSLAFMDLDKFKSVNDNLGHLVGDQYLRRFVDELATKIRADDRIYRVGGDEFLVCFEDIQITKAEQILSRFLTHFFSGSRLDNLGLGALEDLGCSVGLIEYRLDSGAILDKSSLLEEADQLMYQAKKSSGARIYSKVLA